MMRLFTLVIVIVTAVGGFGLYRLKYQVQALDREVNGLQEQVVRDQDAVRILHAEWVYLTRPQRLQDLANKYLALKPTAASQIASAVDEIPGRGTAMASETVPAPGAAPAIAGAMHAIAYQGAR